MGKAALGFDKIKLNNLSRDGIIEKQKISKKDMAIIGMSAKFSLADNYSEFWINLRNGVDAIREFPEHRKEVSDKCIKYVNPGINAKYKDAAYIEDIDTFDYDFFHLTQQESNLMDPHQRMFLHAVWETIEDAGYGGSRLSGTRTGVYAGYKSDAGTWYQRLISEIDPSSMALSVLGNKPTMTSGRVSYLLNLKGPNMLVDTACSSSLAAVHLACKGIMNGDCDMAIVGGVRLDILPVEAYESVGLNEDIGIESRDGRTRTFDDMADGTGIGEGAAAIMLKPLNKAIEDRDNIHAVIKGSAFNHDGTSIGITAPNALAHEELIINAWKDAGVEAETIAYIEAHGTATRLGDPIEIDGIQRAFSKCTDKKQFCGVGSVKSNLGHTDNVAGIAGLIKSVLALKYKEIPPTINFFKANRVIDFILSPLYVNYKLKQWTKRDYPRRCGVSSFGISGSNCHVILEEAPEDIKIGCNAQDKKDIFILSAKSEKVLKDLIMAYKKFVYDNSDFSLSDVCYTANTGRGHYRFRLAMVIEDKEDFLLKIKSLNCFKLEENNLICGVRYGKIKAGSGNGSKLENEMREKSRLAEERIYEWIDSNKKKSDVFDELSELYVEGANIEWNRLYKGEFRRTVSLPTYPFDKQRCWIDIPEITDEARPRYVTAKREKSIQKAEATSRIDYWKVLPASHRSEEDSAEYEAPTNEVELLLSNMWRQVLGIEKVGIYNSFFELGGDSRNAIKLTARIQEEFGTELTLHRFLENPTVEGIAKIIGSLENPGKTIQQIKNEAINLQQKNKNSLFYITERRSLLSLFASGQLAPVDGAALVYLSNDYNNYTELTGGQIIEQFFDNIPVITRVYECTEGRFATICLPLFSNHVYSNDEDLMKMIFQALNIAKIIGARTVSLAGVIPSATDYGKKILTSDTYTENLPKITTGHATTVSAVVLTIKRALEEGGRSLSQECAGFLGLGSIGASTLKLLLKCMPHPKKIILCDIFSKYELLERLREEIITEYEFKGEIQILKSQADAPEGFYKASLMIGATNVSEVLDIERLEAGTILVDDSSPHCFDMLKAIKRMEEKGDILVTEGGVLKSPYPLKQTFYIPKGIEKVMRMPDMSIESEYNPYHIMGCIFSSLLTSKYDDISCNIGDVHIKDSCNTYQTLLNLGFYSAKPHCEQHIISEGVIAEFKNQYGRGSC